MKKELFAAALLAALLSLSLWNTGEIKSLCSELDRFVRASGDAAEAENWEESEKLAASAMSLWKSRELYTHSVLRHTDIETLSDDFYELQEHILTHDAAAVKSAVNLVSEHLEGIADMESLKLGSIL